MLLTFRSSVCLSVYVTLTDYVKMAENIIILFPPPLFCFFHTKHRDILRFIIYKMVLIKPSIK